MVDTHKHMVESLNSPAEYCYNITKSDDALAVATRGLYVGSAGDVVIEDVQGSTTTWKNVVAGTILPVRANKVKAASTAGDFVGLT